MLVKDLIKKLEELPESATIGSTDVSLNDNKSYLLLYEDVEITTYGDINKCDVNTALRNNKCDYYIC